MGYIPRFILQKPDKDPRPIDDACLPNWAIETDWFKLCLVDNLEGRKVQARHTIAHTNPPISCL